MTDPSALAEYYASIRIGSNGSHPGPYAFVDQYIKVRKWFVAQRWEDLRRKIFVRMQWSATEMNAFYHPMFNTVTLPAAMTQSPFIDQSFPPVINYARLGSVVPVEKSPVPLAALNAPEQALVMICSVSLPVPGLRRTELCPELAEVTP